MWESGGGGCRTSGARGVSVDSSEAAILCDDHRTSETPDQKTLVVDIVHWTPPSQSDNQWCCFLHAQRNRSRHRWRVKPASGKSFRRGVPCNKQKHVFTSSANTGEGSREGSSGRPRTIAAFVIRSLFHVCLSEMAGPPAAHLPSSLDFHWCLWH